MDKELTFIAEDFIGNHFVSNTDCAVARASKRLFGKEAIAVGSAHLTIYSGNEPYEGFKEEQYNFNEDEIADNFDAYQEAAENGTFKPFSIGLTLTDIY